MASRTVAEEAAECLRIESGRPRFGIDVGTDTIPQEAGLNERAVSFTKGCYVGQETVARLHYKGKPNRHLRGLRLAAPAERGDEVIGSATGWSAMSARPQSRPSAARSRSPCSVARPRRATQVHVGAAASIEANSVSELPLSPHDPPGASLSRRYSRCSHPRRAQAATARTTRHEGERRAHDPGEAAPGAQRHAAAQASSLLKELPSLHGSERTKAARLLARPTIGQGAPGELEYEVSEATPLCSDHFCVHYVRTTADRPPLHDGNGDGVPDYVETMDAVFEHVYAVENGDLGWIPPKPDGSRGCAGGGGGLRGKTDVYIKEVGDQGIYGYSAPDPGQSGNRQFAYLVMDNDYNAAQFPQYGGNALPPMEVTAAHEYNHVLQFNYDINEDTWMFESTATWMEDRVYTDVNDYLQYITPGRRSRPCRSRTSRSTATTRST